MCGKISVMRIYTAYKSYQNMSAHYPVCVLIKQCR